MCIINFITILCNHNFAAPGTYRPEKFNLDKGPQFSISGKHHVDKPDSTPGKSSLLKNIQSMQNQ